MLAQTHHTLEENQAQVLALVNDLWETEVVPHLPADLAEQAKQHKAFQRQRQVANASDLLRAILGYVLGGSRPANGAPGRSSSAWLTSQTGPGPSAYKRVGRGYCGCLGN